MNTLPRSLISRRAFRNLMTVEVPLSLWQSINKVADIPVVAQKWHRRKLLRCSRSECSSRHPSLKFRQLLWGMSSPLPLWSMVRSHPRSRMHLRHASPLLVSQSFQEVFNVALTREHSAARHCVEFHSSATEDVDHEVLIGVCDQGVISINCVANKLWLSFWSWTLAHRFIRSFDCSVTGIECAF